MNTATQPSRTDDTSFELTRTLARELLQQTDQLADALVESILSQSPVYRTGPVSRDELWRSCHANLEHILEWLADVSSARDGYNTIQSTGRRRAEQRVPLESLLRAFRLGGTVIWEAMVVQARRQGADRVEDLLGVATAVWRAVDRFSSVVGDAYRQKELEILRQDDRRSQALIEGLLLGQGRDRDILVDASRQLGLPVDGKYVVVVADLHAMESALAAPELLLAAHRVRSAWVTRADHEVGLVAVDTTPAGELADLLRPGLRGRCAISSQVETLAEVDHALRLARIALTTVPAGAVEIVCLEDRLPEALVVASPDLAGRIVDATIGSILELADAERHILLETVDAYLRHNRSAARAAAELFCHRNTVANRIRRFESLCGLSLDDARDAMSVRLALTAHSLVH